MNLDKMLTYLHLLDEGIVAGDLGMIANAAEGLNELWEITVADEGYEMQEVCKEPGPIVVDLDEYLDAQEMTAEKR